MKNTTANKWSLISLLLFFGFWMVTGFLSLPLQLTQGIIQKKAADLNKIYGRPWRLFSPPPTYNYRLYLITSSLKTPAVKASIEILENLSTQKRRYIPFNQKENLEEIIVNTYVAGIVNSVWGREQVPAVNPPFPPDSLSMASAIEKAAGNKNYLRSIAAIKNYCLAMLKAQGTDLRNREVKMVISKKMIRPFSEMKNMSYFPTETIVFETILSDAI